MYFRAVSAETRAESDGSPRENPTDASAMVILLPAGAHSCARRVQDRRPSLSDSRRGGGDGARKPEITRKAGREGDAEEGPGYRRLYQDNLSYRLKVRAVMQIEHSLFFFSLFSFFFFFFCETSEADVRNPRGERVARELEGSGSVRGEDDAASRGIRVEVCRYYYKRGRRRRPTVASALSGPCRPRKIITNLLPENHQDYRILAPQMRL